MRYVTALRADARKRPGAVSVLDGAIQGSSSSYLEEGAFLACSFWLAECYARQGALQDAREVFDRAMSAASPHGLFSEQVDPDSSELLGNFPQTLTHLSHIEASLALASVSGESVKGS